MLDESSFSESHPRTQYHPECCEYFLGGKVESYLCAEAMVATLEHYRECYY